MCNSVLSLCMLGNEKCDELLTSASCNVSVIMYQFRMKYVNETSVRSHVQN